MASFDSGNLQAMFDLFCSGKEKSEGKLSIRRIKVWLECAGIVDEQKGIVTEPDVDKVLSNIAKDKITLTYPEFLQCITLLAKEKEMDPFIFMEKLANTTPPPSQLNKWNAEENEERDGR